jgi:uncharacterized protein (DUF58 family)
VSARSRPRWRGWSQLAHDLQRFNHILVPATKEERDRFRNSRVARALRWMAFFVGRFTEDGQMLGAFALLATVLALDVRRSDVYIAWAALAGLLLTSAGYARLFRLRGVRVSVLVPRRVTVGDDATFIVSACNEGPHAIETVLVRGGFLPWDGSWIEGRGAFARLARHEAVRVDLRARFLSRGDHHLDPFRLQALVPFGLALGPALESDGVRFLAVPRIANVRSIAIAQSRRHQPGGVPRALHMADSREFVGVRPYRFGDPIRDLHARSWARAGEPVVREFREEYFSRVGIVLDTDVGDAPDDVFEAAISLVAGIVDRLGRTEALIDVVVLGKTVHPLTMGRGIGALDRVLDLLARVEAEGPFDPSVVGAEVLSRVHSIAAVVFVTLRWDEARRSFAAEIWNRGATCAAFVVEARTGEAGDIGAAAEAMRISPDMIRDGREVAL